MQGNISPKVGLTCFDMPCVCFGASFSPRVGRKITSVSKKQFIGCGRSLKPQTLEALNEAGWLAVKHGDKIEAMGSNYPSN